MDISFTPSLEHLACAKIITLLLNDPDIDLDEDAGRINYDRNTLNVKQNISKLNLPNRLKAKLENFISPILCEYERCAEYFRDSLITLRIMSSYTITEIPQCWLSDGSIDREKLAQILVNASDISPMNRFIIACNFCMFHDILDLWNNFLSRVEKVYLQHKYLTEMCNSDFIIKQWIEWLDSSPNKDWESFVAWTFQTALWKSNVYIMKRVFQTSDPLVRNHYLLEAFRGCQVSSKGKLFGLTIMSKEEREVIFRESPVEVLKCILSWPLRSNFIDLADNLRPFITTDIFCSVLGTILNKIRNEARDYIDLLVILKNWYKQSPSHCKKAAEKDSAISGPLNFVLKYDFARQFSGRDFENSFKPVYNHSTDEVDLLHLLMHQEFNLL